MPNELVASPDPSPALCLPVDRVQNYLENARARNTIKGYRSSFRQFQAWCNRAGLVAMPATPETVALYISAQAEELRPSTLEHHLAAIAKAHKAAGVPSPIQDNLLVRETLKGIKRVHGTALSQKAPVLTEDLRMMLRLVPRNVQGIRDRALLLVGFAGAFRRSELVALEVTDLQFTPEGLLLKLRRSKTDQEGAGRSVAIPHGTNPETCPTQAVKHWLDTVNLSEGAVFRPVRKGGQVLLTRLTGHAVALVVKKWRDSAHKNKQRLMTLHVNEFLRRFLLHVLPPRFVRIRHFGFLSTRSRSTLLPLCFRLVGAPAVAATTATSNDSQQRQRITWLCPQCNAPMLILERMSALQLRLRAPPTLNSKAA